jgi:hypothetical protein
VLEAAHVHVVEIPRARAPEADQGGAVTDGVGRVHRPRHCVRVADVAVDGNAGKARRRGAPREDDRLVSRPRERGDDRATEIARAAGNEDFHLSVLAGPPPPRADVHSRFGETSP